MNDQPQAKKEDVHRLSPRRKVPQVGNIVSWGTLGGEHYRGKVVETDSNVAYVLCEDGVRRCVEC